MSRHSLLASGLILGGLLVPSLLASPQEPSVGDRPDSGANSSDLVARMMKFDKNGDGKLTKAEITDNRMIRLFTRADSDKNGSVTKAELLALDAKERTSGRNGPGGPGGPGGMMGGPPRPGEVLPQMIKSRLNLTADQQTQLDELQRDVDARMAKILTDAQKTQLKQFRDRGPGGPPPGFGGPDGFGDPGFPPPPPQ